MTALWWVLGIVGYFVGGVVFAAVARRVSLRHDNYFDDGELGLIALCWVLLTPIVVMFGVSWGLSWCARKVAGR